VKQTLQQSLTSTHSWRR